LSRLGRIDPAVTISGAISVVLSVGWLVLQPPVPDLAAQSARTMPAASGIWWASWYGGVHTPGYSVLVPPIVRVLGLPAAGALATVVAVLLFARLTNGALRPRSAAAMFAVLAAANLFAGRITFAIGGAFALGALVAAFPPYGREPRTGRVVAAVALAIASSLASPVAGLFLGVAGAAVVLASPNRRRLGFLLVVAAAVPVLVIAVLFPDPGRMLFTRDALKPSFYASLGLIPTLYGRRQGLLRTGAVLSLVLVVGAYLVTSPIGSNAERLALLFGAPIAIGWSRMHRAALLLVLVPLIWWPERNLRQELVRAQDKSAQESYYEPLLDRLSLVGSGRLEVVDPRTHWSSDYVARRVPLARGWERQVDAARNPLFYGRAPLTAASYRAWLDDNAVSAVALPDAPLDFAATAEGRLVAGGLAYLRPVWHGQHWTLFQVERPLPVDDGVLTVTRLDGRGVTLHASAGGSGLVRVHWSPYLHVGQGGCVAKAAGDGEWTQVSVPAAGTYRLSAEFSPLARWRSGCS
jgi:hypothetical protein